MIPRHLSRLCLLAVFGSLALLPAGMAQLQPALPTVQFHVSPAGNDAAAGTAEAPFRTLGRAQQAARLAAETATGDVVVNLAAGVYRLDRTLEFTEADSGR